MKKVLPNSGKFTTKKVISETGNSDSFKAQPIGFTIEYSGINTLLQRRPGDSST